MDSRNCILSLFHEVMIYVGTWIILITLLAPKTLWTTANLSTSSAGKYGASRHLLSHLRRSILQAAHGWWLLFPSIFLGICKWSLGYEEFLHIPSYIHTHTHTDLERRTEREWRSCYVIDSSVEKNLGKLDLLEVNKLNWLWLK